MSCRSSRVPVPEMRAVQQSCDLRVRAVLAPAMIMMFEASAELDLILRFIETGLWPERAPALARNAFQPGADAYRPGRWGGRRARSEVGRLVADATARFNWCRRFGLRRAGRRLQQPVGRVRHREVALGLADHALDPDLRARLDTGDGAPAEERPG